LWRNATHLSVWSSMLSPPPPLHTLTLLRKSGHVNVRSIGKTVFDDCAVFQVAVAVVRARFDVRRANLIQYVDMVSGEMAGSCGRGICEMRWWNETSECARVNPTR
jgi:hypothetical protein